MSQRTRTKTKKTGPSTGVPAAHPARATETAFGWRPLLLVDPNPEVNVGTTLVRNERVYVEQAGERAVSHDLSVIAHSDRDRGRSPTDPRLDGKLRLGDYEVKQLWRKNERQKFDRRFKTGQRGEIIYGKRDAEIKSFALALEREIDDVLEHNVASTSVRNQPSRDECLRFVEETHEFVDLALQRRHSKSFDERLRRLARACLSIPSMTAVALFALNGGIQATDIMRGFDGIEGIFVVAGPIYTLVSRNEIASFLSFDSASSEGPRLRFQGVIPSEQDSVRKAKGKK